MNFKEIIKFWFEELSPSDWWKKDENLDQLIKDRFLNTHEQAINGELFHYRAHSQGRLAEIIIIDQFSRNIFRNRPESFAYDSIALVLSQEAISNKTHQDLNSDMKSFLYMPYMHSESKLIHEEAVKLFSQAGLEFNLDFELKHKKIIDQFGRYPHRNKILGRQSTPEEVDFLKQPNSSF